ncbi:MAG: CopG family transcriptional regulator [Pseudomonadota bacterium]
MRKEYDFSKLKRGTVAANRRQTRTMMYRGDDIVASYREKIDKLGRVYQTLINEALKETLRAHAGLVT